jgi:hypothetical protein
MNGYQEHERDETLRAERLLEYDMMTRVCSMLTAHPYSSKNTDWTSASGVAEDLGMGS